MIMAGWTLYQLTRHYFLALRAYRKVIVYDLLLLVLTAVYVVVCHRLGAVAGLALGAALATIGLFLLFDIGFPRSAPKFPTFELKGLEFGFTNFLSGGVALSLVPIANFTDGPKFAGVMSLVASFSAISALIPRAISMYRLPEISTLVGRGESLARLTAQTRREIMLATGGAFVINTSIALAISLYADSSVGFWYALACGIALCAQGCISMLGLAHSSVLMVREESRLSLTINLITCGLFVALLALEYGMTKRLTFGFVLSVCAAVTIIRNAILTRRSAPFLAPLCR